MAINSVSSALPVQQQAQQRQEVKKSDAADAQKKSNVQDANKAAGDRKEALARQDKTQKVQHHQSQEHAKPATNTNGQTIGTRINTAA